MSDQGRTETDETTGRPEGAAPPGAGGAPDAGGAPEAPPGRDLEGELAQMEDRYKRALADLDNFRKRTARDADRRIAEGLERTLLDWLQVVDTVDRALLMGPEGPLSEGLRPVLEQMEGILERQGVRRVGAPGEPFDPERHEAIGVREQAGAPDRTILEVPRSGFAVDDRVLRPAQVVVSRGPAGDA